MKRPKKSKKIKRKVRQRSAPKLLHAKASPQNLRLKIVWAFLFLLAGSILARAYFLQTKPHEDLEKLASLQHERLITLYPHRGSIFDRNKVELAASIPMDSVFVNPKKISDPYGVAKQLSPLVGRSQKSLLKSLTRDGYFSWIKRQVSPKEMQALKKAIPEGFGTIKENRRFYPHRTLAAHVLGFVGKDGKGLEGLEHRFDRLLRGKTEQLQVQKDARGRIIQWIGNSSKNKQIDGNHIILTLDQALQHIAERELKAGIHTHQAKAGNVVIMNPKTAEILALANWPTFDPNTFHQFHADHLRNRVLTDVFEPGSIMKVVIISKALEKGLLKSDEKLFCENGSYKVKGTTIHDVKKHGWLTPSEILKYSSNICSFKIATRFDPKDLYRALKDFGFGEKTGIPLSGESKGIFKEPKDWYGVTQGNIGFGQGIAVNTLQLIRAYGAIANQGKMLTPKLVKKVINPNGKTIWTPKGSFNDHQAISAKYAKEITEMMVEVTSEEGSGYLAAIPGYPVAGKTGTSQKPDPSGRGYLEGRYVSSFLGFVPAHDPQLVISVVIDEPKGNAYGSQVAAPIFQRVAKQSLLHLGIHPQKILLAKGQPESKDFLEEEKKFPFKLNNKSNRLPQLETSLKFPSHEPSEMPEVRGLTVREGLQRLEHLALELRIEGYGVIVNQKPLPGKSTKEGMVSTLYAKPLSILDQTTLIQSKNRDKEG